MWVGTSDEIVLELQLQIVNIDVTPIWQLKGCRMGRSDKVSL